MQKVSLRLTLIISIIVVLMFSSSAQPIEKPKENPSIGIRVGLLGSGTLYVKGDTKTNTYDKESGISLGISFDTKRTNKIYSSFSFDIYRIKNKYTPETEYLYCFGPLIKKDYPLKKGLIFIPKAGLALGLMKEYVGADKSLHLISIIGADWAIAFSDKVDIILETAVFWDIHGEDNYFKIHSGLIPLIRCGLQFK